MSSNSWVVGGLDHDLNNDPATLLSTYLKANWPNDINVAPLISQIQWGQFPGNYGDLFLKCVESDAVVNPLVIGWKRYSYKSTVDIYLAAKTILRGGQTILKLFQMRETIEKILGQNPIGLQSSEGISAVVVTNVLDNNRPVEDSNRTTQKLIIRTLLVYDKSSLL